MDHLWASVHFTKAKCTCTNFEIESIERDKADFDQIESAFTAIKCFLYFGLPTLILHRVFKKVNPFTRMTLSVGISVCVFVLVYRIADGGHFSIYDIYSTVIVAGIAFYTYSLFIIRKGIPPLVAVTTQNVFVVLLIGVAKMLRWFHEKSQDSFIKNAEIASKESRDNC